MRRAVILVTSVEPCTAEVLNPSLRITASKSLFCTGLAREAANTLPLPVSLDPRPPYALIATIGVLVFLLFVLLMYRAAPSPSTVKTRQSELPGRGEIQSTLTDRH